MKLNIFSKTLLFAGALAMVACSDDAPELSSGGNSTGNEGDGYYMSLNVELPAGSSRSQTTTDGQSTDGNEVGLDIENAVDNVLIVLADENNEYITAASVAGSKLTPIPAVKGYRTIAKIDKTAISEFYNATTNRLIHVFVFCNPTATLLNDITAAAAAESPTKWYDVVCTVLQGNGQTETNTSVWSKNSFLMSNSAIATRKLPPTIEEWKKYNTEASAFDLSGTNSAGQDGEVDNSAVKGRGSVLVERSVARFDFKDGSPLGDNTYNVIYTTDEENNTVNLFNVQLNRIILTNEAKQFYYLPRVSADGQLAGSTLCGSETKTNYVVGPYANVFDQSLKTKFADYFNYPFFNNAGNNDYTQWNSGDAEYIPNVLGNTADNLPDGETDKITGYHIWRYVTENVIPSRNSNQTLGRTTMVVFKGRMVPAEAAYNSTDKYTKAMAEAIGDGTEAHPCNLTGNSTTDPTIYYFNNTPYFGWANIKQAAIQSALQLVDDVPATDDDNNLVGVRRSSSLYLAVFGDGCMGTFTWGGKEYTDAPTGMAIDSKSTNALYDAYVADKTDENLAALKAAVTGQKITIYESSNDSQDGPGYYFYYYYRNRHNDNNDNGTMGAMEFATVRNNVYKLAVTKINSLGHPRIPENDPDAPDPDTPDESDDIYISVTCRVLPWVVRVNNIEF